MAPNLKNVKYMCFHLLRSGQSQEVPTNNWGKEIPDAPTRLLYSERGLCVFFGGKKWPGPLAQSSHRLAMMGK